MEETMQINMQEHKELLKRAKARIATEWEIARREVFDDEL